MKIKLLELEDILKINRAICFSVKQKSVCMDQRKIESALGAAFYPGDYPFQYGDIAKVAGALCYFIIKAHAFMDGNKRTAMLAATVLMDLNGYELRYPMKIKNGITALTDVIEKAATNQLTKDEVINWFDQHKKTIKE